MRCPACQADAPENARFCQACGRAIATHASNDPTIDSRSQGAATRAFMPPAQAPPPQPPSPLTSSSFNSFDGAFAPGQILVSRYRIVSLLGKGGMGEVYRADDLALGVSCALKFLPASIAADAVRLDRFRAEVRTTRQISHPNVCRVFDIGEIEGRPFLSMEYVDGEDLASLLRRIGHLPQDKSLQIARQVCAGLAIAHDLGIVHRDLKPANIMLDGRGQARLMDFGVAGQVAELAARGDVAAGTPVYMAPEQLAGHAVTHRSDIYSLGLVLYELFTGKPAWADRATSLAELRRLHQSSKPTSASSLVADLDPAVERVIERCLDPDPANRPSNAIAVAAALPGGDPLAAALAAGETPSPEMVAQAGRVGAMPPRKAIAFLASAAIALITLLALNSSTSLLTAIRPEVPPAVMASKARDILKSLGHSDKPKDESFAYFQSSLLLQHLRADAYTSGQPNWPDRLSDPLLPALQFFYRASPTPLHPDEIWQPFASFDDPVQTWTGSARLLLDSKGRLIRFEAIPKRVPSAPPENAAPTKPFDWSTCFTHAGLDMSAFTPAEPRWTPLMASDHRAAWEGTIPTVPPTPVRIEAASERGRPVSFFIVYPWTRMDRDPPAQASLPEQVFEYANIGLLLAAMLGGAFLAWRNIRAGRNDRRGAAAVALFILVVTWIGVGFGRDTIATAISPELVGKPLARALWLAMVCWLFYTALEPVFRRLWPKSIISWTRLLTGRCRDPLVGGDILIGVALGLILNLCLRVGFALPGWLGGVPPIAGLGALDALRGPRATISTLCTGAGAAIAITMLLAMLLIGARIVLRRNALAIIAAAIVLFGLQAAAFEFHRTTLPLAAGIAALLTFVMLRVGLLTLAVCLFTSNAIGNLPVTTDLSLWYAGQTFTQIAAAAALALFGFFTALAGQNILANDPFADR